MGYHCYMDAMREPEPRPKRREKRGLTKLAMLQASLDVASGPKGHTSGKYHGGPVNYTKLTFYDPILLRIAVQYHVPQIHTST